MAILKSLHRGGGRWWLIGTGLVAAAFTVFFVAASSANLTGSTFEGNDGNLVVNTAGNHDWDNAPNLSVGSRPPDRDDRQLVRPGREGRQRQRRRSSPARSRTARPTSLGSRVAGETVGANTFLYLAWSRENQNGTVNFDFEINAAGAAGSRRRLGPKTLVRTVNDLLINYGFRAAPARRTHVPEVDWHGLGRGDADLQHLFRGGGEHGSRLATRWAATRPSAVLLGSSARRRSTSSALA